LEAISDIKDLLGKKVELKLFVKVEENWTKKREHLQNAGVINH
jgi:GTPase Era involved in 16S rRNA processing